MDLEKTFKISCLSIFGSAEKNLMAELLLRTIKHYVSLSVSSEIVSFVSFPPYIHDTEEETEYKKDNNSIKNFIHTRSI